MVSERLTVTVNAGTATAQAKLNRLRETVQSLGRSGLGAKPGLNATEEGIEGVGIKAVGALPPTKLIKDQIEETGDKASTSALQLGAFTSALSSLSPAALHR